MKVWIPTDAVRSTLLAAILSLAISSCGSNETHEIPPEPVCATPVLAPPPGAYGGPTAVTITSATDGAAIHYTLDGTTPIEGSPLYAGPVTISSTKLLEARAWKSGFQPSDVATGAYTIAVTPCTLGVSAPGAGTVWTAGSHHAIQWQSTNCGASVKIELLRNGSVCRVIAESAPNTGSYDWVAARCGNEPQGYRVRLTDASSGETAESAETFEIAEACAIQVLSPNGGEGWTLGTAQEIRWTSAAGCGPQARIDLLREGTVCATIAEATENGGSFLWTVAACGGALDGYAVRVTDIGTNAADESDATFALLPPMCVMDVVAPDGGEVWDIGSSKEIRWQSSGCGASVRIDLLRDGTVCSTIADSTENDGRYAWITERCESEASGYKIRVTDRASGIANESNASFAIPAAACTLTLFSPNGGEVWEEGTDHEITWRADGCSSLLQIDLVRNGEPCLMLWTGRSDAGRYVWRVERCTGQTDGYTIRLSTAEATAESIAPFTITPATVPCEMAVTAPDSGAVLWSGSREMIRWNATGCGSLARIDLLCNGVVCDPIVGYTPNTGEYEWRVFACCGDSCAHSVRVTDLSSNTTAGSAPFCVRTCVLGVVTPAAHDVWIAGEERTIAWNTEGCGPEVRIELTSLETGHCLTIIDRTENDGTFAWTVAACPAGGTSYLVNVTDLTSGSEESSNEFSILEHNPCLLAVTSPNGGERWPAGSARTVTWNAASCGSNVRIELRREGVTCATLAAAAPNTGSFDWTVAPCGADSMDYRIAVTDLEQEVTDQSDAPFRIPFCAIALDAPVGGERWDEGAPQTIAWHSTVACDGPVRIDLICDGQTCRTVVASTEDDGSYEWTPEACCADICTHRIRVTSLASGASAESPASFCICPPCAPTVTAPNGGEEWKAGTVHAITWNPADCGETVKIELLRNGSLCRTLASAAPNTGTFTWTVQGCDGTTGGYAIRVTGSCDAADASDVPFTIPECGIDVTSPAPGDTWAPGSPHDIAWTSDQCGGTVRIELWKGGGFCSTLATGAPNDGVFGWTAQTCGGASGCDYQIRVIDEETQRIGVTAGFFCICPPCAPVVISPNGGESWQEGSGFDIVWSPSLCDASVSLDLWRDGAICGAISAGTQNDGLFHWTAARCGRETTGYRVIVTGLTCGQSDTTDADFTIPPMPCSLDLVSPDGGESWSRNTTHLIRWDTAGDCGDYVKIELLQGGLPCLTIVESTGNDGTFSWAAVGCGEVESGYAIRVTELMGNKTTQSAGVFSIPICRVAVSAPNGGEEWMAETERTITWDANAACGSTVRIELQRNGTTCMVLTEQAPNTGAYSWIAQNCGGLADGYKVRVIDTATGSADASDAVFRIPTPPCSIAVTAPNGGESWAEGSARSITWTPAHCGASVRIELLRDGSPCSVIAASAPNTGSYAWNAETCVGQPGSWKIRVTDLDSQAADESDQAFLIPTAADAYVLPQNLAVCRGAQNVEVVLRGRNSQALQGYGVSVCYDTDVFTCTGVSIEGTRGAGAPYFESDCGSGCARAGVIVSNACPPQIDAGDGPILKLTLRVKADAPLGITTFDLRTDGGATNTMARCGGTGIDPTLVDGRVTICGGTPR